MLNNLKCLILLPDWFGNLNQLTYLCTQSYEKVIKTPKMELKKLKTQSLVDALKSMNVGETCIAPDECTPTYVKKACSELKEKGYLFTTSTKTGVQTITRLQ